MCMVPPLQPTAQPAAVGPNGEPQTGGAFFYVSWSRGCNKMKGGHVPQAQPKGPLDCSALGGFGRWVAAQGDERQILPVWSLGLAHETEVGDEHLARALVIRPALPDARQHRLRVL